MPSISHFAKKVQLPSTEDKIPGTTDLANTKIKNLQV